MDDAKRFLLKCKKCNWHMFTSGKSEELKELKEVSQGCANCGRIRQFHCPQCRNKVLMAKNVVR